MVFFNVLARVPAAAPEALCMTAPVGMSLFGHANSPECVIISYGGATLISKRQYIEDRRRSDPLWHGY